MLDLENPQNAWPRKPPVLCNVRCSVSWFSWVLANFVFENQQLVTMVTRVGLRQISMTPLNCPIPKPHFGANIFPLSLKVPELLPMEIAIGRNSNFQILGKKRGQMWKFIIETPKRHFLERKRVVWRIDRENRSTVSSSTCKRVEETKRKKKGKSQTVIFHACADTPHAARSLPYLEVEV